MKKSLVLIALLSLITQIEAMHRDLEDQAANSFDRITGLLEAQTISIDGQIAYLRAADAIAQKSDDILAIAQGALRKLEARMPRQSVPAQAVSTTESSSQLHQGQVPIPTATSSATLQKGFTGPSSKKWARNPNFNLAMKTIGGLAAVAIVWILAKKLFGNKSIFRNINQILIAAEKHNDKLKELNKEISTKETLSSKEEIIRLLNQCHVIKLTADLKTTVPLVTKKMKQDWTTLRTAHATFLDAWESIRKILNTANKTQLDDELIDVKGRLNKMHVHLSAIDQAVNS